MAWARLGYHAQDVPLERHVLRGLTEPHRERAARAHAARAGRQGDQGGLQAGGREDGLLRRHRPTRGLRAAAAAVAGGHGPLHSASEVINFLILKEGSRAESRSGIYKCMK